MMEKRNVVEEGRTPSMPDLPAYDTPIKQAQDEFTLDVKLDVPTEVRKPVAGN
jgi:hypothetical protein